VDAATHSALFTVLYDEFDSFVSGHSEPRIKARSTLDRLEQLLDAPKKPPAIRVEITAATPAGHRRSILKDGQFYGGTNRDGTLHGGLHHETLHVTVSLTGDEVRHLAGHAPSSAQSFYRDVARSELLALLESDEVLDEESAHVLWKTLWRWARKSRT
jgi:hypothetical protein